MDGIAGVEIQAAFKKAAAWNTAVEAGAGDGVLILPTSIRKDSGVEVDDSLGTYFSGDGDPGAISVAGDLPMYLRYDGLDLFLAMVLGTAGAPVLEFGAVGAYGYKYKPAKSVKGLFGTFVKNMKNYIEEIPSVKLAGLTIRGDAGQPLQVVFRVIGIDKITDSAINTAGTFVNVTIPETKNRVRFAHGVFLLNDQGDVALDAGTHKITPSSFELSYQPNLAGVHTGEYRSAAPNVQELIDEPLPEGEPEIRLKLQFPRHADNSFLLDLAQDTRKKARFTFTGSEIEAGHSRKFGLEFPHLQPLNDDPTDEKGRIQEPLEYIVHKADAAPAGMTETDPFHVFGVNTRSTDPLA